MYIEACIEHKAVHYQLFIIFFKEFLLELLANFYEGCSSQPEENRAGLD